MLTKTTISAIRALIYLAHQPPGEVCSPKRVAEEIFESPTYLSKISRLLVKAGILRAERGVKGGVQLNRKPQDITLLSIVEACEGTLLERHCQAAKAAHVCAFHQAATDVHHAVLAVLNRWTLAALIKNPGPTRKLSSNMPCLMNMRAAAGSSSLVQMR